VFCLGDKGYNQFLAASCSGRRLILAGFRDLATGVYWWVLRSAMIRDVLGFLLAASLTGFALGQTSPPPAAASDPQAPAGAGPQQTVAMRFTPGTQIRAQLDKAIDAKKAKVGDEITAKTTDDLNSNPPGRATKGCKLIGHLVEASPHQGDTPAVLGIVFDKMILKDGSEMPMTASIQAIGFADDFNPATDSEMIGQMGAGPGQRQGSAPGGVVGAGSGQPSSYAGQRLPGGGGSTSDAKLPFNAKGAVGMSGVTLGPGPAQDSVLTGKKRNVKLENGMQMIVRVTQ